MQISLAWLVVSMHSSQTPTEWMGRSSSLVVSIDAIGNEAPHQPMVPKISSPKALGQTTQKIGD